MKQHMTFRKKITYMISLYFCAKDNQSSSHQRYQKRQWISLFQLNIPSCTNKPVLITTDCINPTRMNMLHHCPC